MAAISGSIVIKISSLDIVSKFIDSGNIIISFGGKLLLLKMIAAHLTWKNTTTINHVFINKMAAP